MNIGELAKANNVSTDTVRYYERQGILDAPLRQDNGYRNYTRAHVETLRFVRTAQSLGFSLSEIRAILPQLADGRLDRNEIEQRLQLKMTQIDNHIRQLKTMKSELQSMLGLLDCTLTPFGCQAEATPPQSREKIARAARNKFSTLTHPANLRTTTRP